MPTWLTFLLVLSVLVLVHELGHFLAARLLGIKVEEFAFGLPFTRPLLKIKVHGTQYAIYPVMFGGFVRLYGEEHEVEENKKHSFWHRSKKERMAVILAGVVMNVVLALVAFGVLYGRVGVPGPEQLKVTIEGVEPGSPAQSAGLAAMDRVVEVEGKTVSSTEEFGTLMKSWGGLGVNLTVERGTSIALFEGLVEQETQRMIVNVIPRLDPPEGQGALGIVISAYPYLKTSTCRVIEAGCLTRIMAAGITSTKVWMGRVVEGLQMIGKSLVAGKAPEGVSGPVGIYQLTGAVASQGWLPLLELVAVLSVNLAVFNVLPVPALDGGRMMFVVLELLLGRRLPGGFEQKINSWGMIFLIGLMVLVSFQDVLRLGILEKLW